MLRTLHQIYKIKTSSRINSILYFLKKLPILKNKLKNTNYSFLRFKKAIGIVSIIYNIISNPISSLLIFLLSIFLPSIFIARENSTLAIATLIFFFHYLFHFISSSIMDYDYKKFIMVKQMRMDARNYSLATTIPEGILKLIGKAIIFTIFLDFSSFTFYGVILALSITCTGFFAEALHVHIYDKYGFSTDKHNTLLLILYMALIFPAYLLAFISPFRFFLDLLLSPVFLLLTTILGLGGVYYLYKYDNYLKLINETNNIDNMTKMKNTVAEAQFGDVKIKEKDYKGMDLSTNKYSNKEGYGYLNAIFFDRHKRMVYRPMVLKSLIIIGIFLILIIASEFFFAEMGPTMGTELYERFTLFVFAMYILCNSERVIKSMFHNCDISLLRYGFYKKGDALLKMFFLRIIRIFYYNLVPTTFLAIGTGFVIVRYTSFSIIDIMPIILLLYALAMFFSMHYIFMYYIFQPFTTSLQVKNPFYSLINFLVYFVSYMLIQIPAPPSIFLPIMVSLLIVYVLVAILLVYKRAPVTFRIK